MKTAMTPRLVECRTEPGYQLRLRFTDGAQGVVSLRGLIGIGAFQLLRDVYLFQRAKVSDDGSTVTWDCGVRLDTEVLHHDVVHQVRAESEEERKLLAWGAGQAKGDRDFQRFLRSCTSMRRRRSRRR